MIYRLKGIINPIRGILNVFILINIIVSSILLNSVQLIVTLCFFLPEKDRLNYCQIISTYWWKVWPFVLEIWDALPIYYYGVKIRNDENAIMHSNHNAGMDCLPGTLIVDRFDFGMGRTMVMMKASLRFLPTVGIMHYFQGSLFLSRDWEKDRSKIDEKLHALDSKSHPHPFVIGLFPEGTRFTKKKQAEGWKFAEERNLPKLHNVLLPRKKGFVHICSNLSHTLESIYTVTTCYEGKTLQPVDFLLGMPRCQAIHIHCKRTPVMELPKDPEELYRWLVNEYVEIDQRIDHFKKHNAFRESYLFTFSQILVWYFSKRQGCVIVSH
eukprot:g63686.t1